MNKYKEITDSMDKHNILSIATSVMEVAPGKYMKGRPHQLPGLYRFLSYLLFVGIRSMEMRVTGCMKLLELMHLVLRYCCLIDL